jgi:hypothetical protein
MLLLLAVCCLLATGASAWGSGGFKRATAGAFLAFSLSTTAALPAHADGLDLGLVFNKIQKVQERETKTPFDQLAPKVQRRLALKTCDDQGALKVSGFSNRLDCRTAVFDGDTSIARGEVYSPKAGQQNKDKKDDGDADTAVYVEAKGWRPRYQMSDDDRKQKETREAFSADPLFQKLNSRGR